jgi:hypothetical protein
VAVVVNIAAMRDDLRSFGKAARRFIRNDQRLFELDTQLLNAAAEAGRGDRKLEWTTDLGSGDPIRTELSSSYRNHGAGGAKPIFAEISFCFAGYLDAVNHNRFVIRTGGTRVKLCWEGAPGETLCHFDIHPDEAGHPMLHVQFNGLISELPRLHAIFAHPLDIFEFTLMEVFQDKWRKVRIESKFANEIRKYPANQRRRILLLLSSYSGWVNCDEPALLSLLKTPPAPLELYPAG